MTSKNVVFKKVCKDKSVSKEVYRYFTQTCITYCHGFISLLSSAVHLDQCKELTVKKYLNHLYVSVL